MLTIQERNALKTWWRCPLRIKNGNIELKKGDCWGMLCNAEEGKKNAQLLLKRR